MLWGHRGVGTPLNPVSGPQALWLLYLFVILGVTAEKL